MIITDMLIVVASHINSIRAVKCDFTIFFVCVQFFAFEPQNHIQ